MITHIVKRDGRVALFNTQKIADAIYKSAQSIGGNDYKEAERLSLIVSSMAEQIYGSNIPTVEQIQDIVEKVLIEEGHATTSKAYILYRYERTRSREMQTNLM